MLSLFFYLFFPISVPLQRFRLNDHFYRTTFQRFHRQRRRRRTRRIAIHRELR